MDETATTASRPRKDSVRDLAEHYGVHENTVYNWLRSDNPPPHIKVGRQYRFSLEEVDETWSRPEAA